MKKTLLLSAAALALLSTQAFAADNTPSAPTPITAQAAADSTGGSPTGRHPMTLEEARKRAHERAEKLDKMTPGEYAARQEKRKEWRNKWKAMTPEEKAAYKKKKHDERAQKTQSGVNASGVDTTPAAAPSTPPAR